jgi:hypothetical protein
VPVQSIPFRCVLLHPTPSSIIMTIIVLVLVHMPCPSLISTLHHTPAFTFTQAPDMLPVKA